MTDIQSGERDERAGAPSGTVTFLFTDIEGSTRLLERLRGQYATVLAEHYQILRAAFAKWNGHEIRTEGDSCFVTFARATDALCCVIEGQRALAVHLWPQGAEVRVRMGLHTGEPITTRLSYVGLDVHLAARIASAGHGGQVLLSETTQALVHQDLPIGVSLRDLGEHKLKDIRHPQPIYQLDIQGLPSEFPPLKTLTTAEEPPAPGEPPFKGLQYFDEPDAGLFFGREKLTAELVEYVLHHRFLAVIGASGSGKSSIVRAGLVPALRRKRLGDTELWQIHIITPTAHPLESLATALTRTSESVTAAITFMDDLARDPRSLHLYVRKNLAPAAPHAAVSTHRLLLVVDQFEELFTLCRNEAERHAFVSNLLHATETEGGLTTAVIALRADFYEHLAQYAGLREAVSKHQEYIGPMNASELRLAMEEPAKRGGVEFDPGLVDLILQDVGAGPDRQPEPGALPLLSHALLETWKRRRGKAMTFKGYSEAGGVRGAIARTAESVYFQDLTLEQQPIARTIFLRLTELGEGTQDTRRRVARSEIIPPAPPSDAARVEAVLVKLADARLITTGEGTVEVAHEALIREWPTLREWLAQNREALRLHRQITEAAQEWERLGRDPGSLYRGVRLARAQEWAAQKPFELNLLEQSFLDASVALAEQEEAEREAQRNRELEAAHRLAESEGRRAEDQARSAARLRRRALLLAGASVLAVVLAAVAFLAFRQASRNANLATSRELAAAAINNLNVDPELSALLSLKALDTTYTLEAENALHASLPALHLLKTTPLGGQIETLTVSPNGKIIAAGEALGSSGERIWLLDGDTGQLLREITTAQRVIFGLSFNPDGSRLASVDWDGNAIVWDVVSGEQVLAFHAHDGGASRIAYSPDGTRLATGGDDATAKIWDSATGALLLTLTGHARAMRTGSLHPGGVIEVAYTPDGKRLVTGGADGTTRIWDASTGGVLQVLSGHSSEMNLGINPDGTRLATAGADGFVKIWDLSPGSQVDEPLVLINHEQPARSLAVSPDGTRIAVASEDGAARVWDTSTGVRQLVLVGHTGDVNDVAFGHDGTRLYTGSADKTVKIWDLAPGREVLAFPGSVPFYSPDGKELGYGIGSTVQIRDAATGRVLRDLPISEQPSIGSATFSPDGRRIATSSWDGTASVWDAASGVELATFAKHGGRVWRVVFSPDGTRAVSASADKTARVWDAATGKELLTLSGHTDNVQDVDFSPDGKTIATASWDKTVRIWDAASGEELLVIQSEVGLFALHFSPDSTRLAVASTEGVLFVWDISKGQADLLYTLTGHTATVGQVAFSPDGKYLAAPSFDGTLKVWRMDTGEEWLTIEVGAAPYLSLSPDGEQVATGGLGGPDSAVRVCSLDLREAINLAEARVTRALTDEECRKFLHVSKCP